MVALSEGHSGTVETLTAELRRLDSTVHPEPSESDDYRRTSLDPPVIRPRQTPPPIVEDEPEEELPQVATEPDEDAPGPDEDHDNRTPAEDTTAPQETPDDAPGPDEDHDNRTPAEEEPTAGATAADPEEPTARELPPELQ
jgi:hypothetical protein